MFSNFKKTVMINNKNVSILIVLLINVSTAFSQVLIYSEPFDNNTNLVGSFDMGTSSGTCGNNDAFSSTNNANILACITGEVGSVFCATDTDDPDLTVAGNPLSFIMNIPIDASETGLINFTGSFSAYAFGSTLNAGDNFIIEADIGSGYNTIIRFDRNGGNTFSETSTLPTNGSTLTTTFVTRSIDLGSGLNGTTINVRVTFNNLTSNGQGACLDEFQFFHTPPPCSANPGTLSK